MPYRNEPALNAFRLLETVVILAALLFAIGMRGQQPAPAGTWHPTDAEAREMSRAIQTLVQFVTQPAAATYRFHGPAILNDLTVTPGAVGTTPQATLCSPSFHTGTVRNVPESLKQRVCRNYGIARADCTGQKVEIDHLISLELGGTNDEANLWPQPYAPAPGAKQKDIVENWLHRQVCSNAIPLAQAQHDIATDWYQIYLNLTAPPAPQAQAFHPGTGDSVICGKGADCVAFLAGMNDATPSLMQRGEQCAKDWLRRHQQERLHELLHAPDLIGAAR